jgi:hypothetical protein
VPWHICTPSSVSRHVHLALPRRGGPPSSALLQSPCRPVRSWIHAAHACPCWHLSSTAPRAHRQVSDADRQVLANALSTFIAESWPTGIPAEKLQAALMAGTAEQQQIVPRLWPHRGRHTVLEKVIAVLPDYAWKPKWKLKKGDTVGASRVVVPRSQVPHTTGGSCAHLLLNLSTSRPSLLRLPHRRVLLQTSTSLPLRMAPQPSRR